MLEKALAEQEAAKLNYVYINLPGTMTIYLYWLTDPKINRCYCISDSAYT